MELSKILKHPLTIAVPVAIAAFSSGYVIGHKRGIKREVIVVTPSEEPEEVEEEDPNQMKLDLMIHDEEIRADPELREAVEVIIVEQYAPPIAHSFVRFSGRDNWDYEEEAKNRPEDMPYVLHYDEYMNDERGYSQTTLTFFSGDNILVDEEDVPIYNHDSIVGEMKFGHGSNDPNVVYIRNPRMKAEWEILFSAGSYAEEVLGMDIEKDIAQRSSKKETPKFRKE